MPDQVRHLSPNHGPRRGGVLPSLIVLHYTAMATTDAALARLCDPAAEVSAHYLIGYDGTIWHLVPEDQRAWHAGAGAWGAITDVNSHSIGIELANNGAEPFPHPQMRALDSLLRGLMERWQIPPQNIIGHSDMAPTRKSDPGPRFDWRRLARQGLSVWPEPGPPLPLGPSLRAFGYPDAPPDALLRAFRLRFRPHATGPIDPTDEALAANLARRFAVDPSPASA